MENNQEGETIHDIHNYLANFDKEIQTSNASGKNLAQVFVDENGQYYYQAVDGEEMVIMENSEKDDVCSIDIKKIKRSLSPTPSEEEELESFEVAEMPEKDIGLSGTQSIQVLPSVGHGQQNGQVILNSGDNNQIVTIVPSSTNPGEVSYVLIVEQSAENDKDDTVYDFNEVDEGLTYVTKNSMDDEDKKFSSRILPKKSQTITPVHMCNYCNYTSSKRYLLARHMRCHSEERPHKCAVCERGFKTLASLQNHLNTHTGIKPHKCKFCESTFTTSGELVRHVRYIHTHEKPHKCTDCSYASVELSKLKRHMRCHTGERPYQCPHCTYASPDTFKLKRHLRIHTGEKPYECDICNATFTQSNSLKAHKMIHTGNKPIYNCELCPTTCGRKTDLRIHIQKLHTSDKPLKCKKCGKVYPDRYSYKQHNKTHDGEKCFKCDLCPYASAAARHLESHMLVHTEQKPYKCKNCDQTFRQKQLLKRHQNLYHNPLYIPPIPREKTQECPDCSKAFRHKGNLIRHMAIHDPDASAQEKADAVRAGHDRRFEIINGEEVEVFSGDVDDEVDEEMMTVEGQDGNQYVVLEVIQLQDGDGHVMMTDGINSPHLDAATVLSSSLLDSSGLSGHHRAIVSQSLLDLGEKKMKTELPDEPKKDAQKEMDSCFGFDDEDGPKSNESIFWRGT